jgi:NAD(P)H-dependent FMN reductase
VSQVALIAGSPAHPSRSRALLERAAETLTAAGHRAEVIDLAALPSDGLLGRRRDESVLQALETLQAASLVIVATPVYRETFSGLLKVFFDQLRPDDLRGRDAITIATGALPAHAPVVTAGLTQLLASVGARVVGRLFATDEEFSQGRPTPELVARLERILAEAVQRGKRNGHGGPIGVYYEHPHWFEPLFAELDRRGVAYERILADGHRFDPAASDRFALVFNRMSPSAWLRGRGHAVLYTQQWLRHLEENGTRVVNGAAAFAIETSKALQLSLLEQLGLPYPPARVIHDPAQAAEAAGGLRFPVVVKPNIGGSGAGVVRFDTLEALAQAAANGSIDLGPDHTGLVQEFIPAEEGRIVRVEVLDGRYLYAIRVYSAGDSFNLCPADVCQTVEGTELARTACPVDAPRNGLRVEAYTPPASRIREVERIMAQAGIEIGGVEYIVDARDGRHYYYDINALSNFVADGPRVLGFDPFARLADWLEREAA